MRSKVGNVYEVAPGRWRVRVSKGFKPDGSRRVISKMIYGSKDEAEAEARRLAVAMGAAPSYGNGVTVDSYFKTIYLPTRNNLKQATLKSHKSNYEHWIKDRFGDLPLEAITRPMVQAWVSELPPASAKNYFRTLSVILNGAVDDGVLDMPLNLSRLRFPRRDYKPEAVKVWTAETVAEAFYRLEGSRIYPLWLVMIGAGLSRSEGCGLDWSDISKADNWTVVRVNKARTARDGLQPPKNAYRYRVVPVALPFGDKLLEYAGEGPLWPWHPDFAARVWSRCFDDELAGLPYVPLNNMRATHETLLQLAGVVDSVNARIHGRSNVQTGYLHYQHPALGAFGEAAEGLAGLFE